METGGSVKNDRVTKWILKNGEEKCDYRVFSCGDEILLMYRPSLLKPKEKYEVLFRSSFSGRNRNRLKIEYWKNNSWDWKLTEA